MSSRDHPQHPFFEALTQNPTHTLAWLAVGAAFLQSWWAGWLRQWSIEIVIRGTDAEKRIERARYERLKFQVHHNAYLYLKCSLTVMILGL
jgi:phosphatidylinositol glycan class F